MVKRGLKIPARGEWRDPTPETVKGWRKKFRNARPDDAKFFRSIVDDVTIVTTDMDRARVDILRRLDNILKNYEIGT